MSFYPGFDVSPVYNPLGFKYGETAFGSIVENRTLDSIRESLIDLNCDGPEIVYSIAMDIGSKQDKPEIMNRNLLYGAVTYAKGQLGKEPVRSQGHIHAISQSCRMSTCEVYEIWDGSAYVYMQETAQDDPGRCFAVFAKPGDIVIVPPGWAHCTISTDTTKNMTFGAWCVRDYGFDYDDVRQHNGLAWVPVVKNGKITFLSNKKYHTRTLIKKHPRVYIEFGLETGEPIYTQFAENPEKFLFVSKPQSVAEKWKHFIP